MGDRDSASLAADVEVPSALCQVCAGGLRPPSVPAGSSVRVPSSADSSVTVTQALRVARRLAHDNEDLWAHADLVRALNAGLATHASVLHDQNVALLARAREGYEIGLNTVRRLYDERDALKVDLQRLEEQLETAKKVAFEAGQWKIKFDVLTATTNEQTHVLQDELARVRAEHESLAAELATRSASPSELDDLARAHQTRDAAARELQTTREALSTASQEADMLRASRSLLEADLRRVTALLTAHAEEHQRDVVHIRELEDSVSQAESARVVAESGSSDAAVEVLRVESRTLSYRRLLVEARQHGHARVQALTDRAQRLQTRMMELDQERDLAAREHADQVASWRRLLRRARTGRESALRVRNALGARLAASVTQVGGTLDIDGLMRQLEREVEAAASAAVTIPADARQAEDSTPESPIVPPASVPAASSTGPDGARRRTGGLGFTTPPRRSPVGHGSRSSTGSGSRSRSSTGSGSRSGNLSDRSAPSSGASRRLRPGGPFPSQVGASAQRRSRRPTTIADSAATASAAATTASSPLMASASTQVGQRKRRRRLVETPSDSSAEERPPPKAQRSAPTGLTRSSEEDENGSSSSSSEGGFERRKAKIVPFFRPVIPPFPDTSEWDGVDTAPWPRSLVSATLANLDVRTIRLTYLPPDPWFYPAVAQSAPADWNTNLVTLASVEDLYATRPWSYLAELLKPLTFAIGDAAFQPFVARLTKHLDHWAQAYWEASHDFELTGCNRSCDRWRRNRNSRRSRAGDHLASALQLVTDLFRRGLADMDLLLDPVFLHFPPYRSDRGRWYPGREHATLAGALEDVDRREPWRRFFRSMPNADGSCSVTPAHPAYSLDRLAGKFIEEI